MNATRQVAALLLSAAFLATATLAPRTASAEPEKKVSRDLAKTLKAAQDAINAKKYPEALAKLKEAESNPKKTPFDEHVINQFSGLIYVKQNNYPEAARAFEAQLNDGFLDQKEVPGIVKALAQISYQIKNYDKAIEFGNRAIKGGYGDEDLETVVGQAYYLKGDWKGTLKFEEGLVEEDIKKGKTPKDQQLQLVLSACVKLQDADCTTNALEKLVSYYPKTEYWQNLLYTIRQANSQSDKAMLQTYRLMYETDILKEPNDYSEMAQLAIEQGSPGEAQHVLERGFQKNVFTDARLQDKNKRLLESAKKLATADQATLPKMEKDADSAATGDKAVALGLAYLGYQQYDKAADDLNKGLQKGGVRNEPEARLLLGIAQLKAGRKEDAVKSFRAVKGDPALERLANLWALHAKQA
ncbi:MAG TPA: tetratricopeptide repeat protein [Steroidobacteraceae bacterium]|nr:tetratricopeptide repeat protein [Steroidobacteraceae bacterium]